MKKKVIFAAGLVMAIIFIAVFFTVHTGKGEKHKGFVFSKSSNIRAKDVRTYFIPGDFNSEDPVSLFKNGIINPYTLQYFLFLDERFKDSKNIEELLQRAHHYLYAAMSRDEADKLFALYRSFVYYEQGLSKETKSWGTPSTPEEAIEYLHRIQEYRREIFGKEIADALFGPSVKSEEYMMRRGMVVNDADKYGADKEKMLNELKKNMWGDEGDLVDSYNEPLNRYYEKLKIYQKDLAEMKSDEERQAETRQFREELFTPEQVRRLDEVDQVIAEDKKKEENYSALENRINNDPGLDATEKSKKIRELQDEIFGKEADAFRRRLAIEKGK